MSTPWNVTAGIRNNSYCLSIILARVFESVTVCSSHSFRTRAERT